MVPVLALPFQAHCLRSSWQMFRTPDGPWDLHNSPDGNNVFETSVSSSLQARCRALKSRCALRSHPMHTTCTSRAHGDGREAGALCLSNVSRCVCVCVRVCVVCVWCVRAVCVCVCVCVCPGRVHADVSVGISVWQCRSRSRSESQDPAIIRPFPRPSRLPRSTPLPTCRRIGGQEENSLTAMGTADRRNSQGDNRPG
jgi:hypothetical protein